MFSFDKRFIGVYCNRLRYMTYGKGVAPFNAMAELKQTAQAKMLMSQI